MRAGEIKKKHTFSKVSSQLNLLYKITMELTFENVYLRYTLERAGEIETKQKFLKVSSLLNSGYKIPMELIFENFYLVPTLVRAGEIETFRLAWLPGDRSKFSKISEILKILKIQLLSHILSVSSGMAAGGQVKFLKKFSKVSSIVIFYSGLSIELTFENL